MRSVRVLITLGFALVSFSATVPAKEKETRWRTFDEGTFTLEVPVWLKKVHDRPLHSHAGEYYARSRMRVNFDEIAAGASNAQKGKTQHDNLARKFASGPQDESSTEFIKKIGDRYAKISVSYSEKWLEAGYPGRNAVEVLVPNPSGGHLSLWITFRDPGETPIALRIAKSIAFK